MQIVRGTAGGDLEDELRSPFEILDGVFPLATLTLLLVMANFILGAAAHTRALPPLVHELLAWTTLACCVITLHREYRALGDNNRLIAEAGQRRRSPPGSGR